MDTFRFEPPLVKDPGDSIRCTFDWRELLTTYWRAGTPYGTGVFVRPSASTGYAYECTTPGVTGAREPTTWPRTLGGTLLDGSVTWTCRAAGSSGVQTIQGSPTVTASTGLTAGTASVENVTDVVAVVSGGTDGQDYEVACTVTTSTQTIVGRRVVQVRRR